MAQIDINTIENLEKSRNTLHDKVYATYTSFEMDGKHYLQIDTYGKSDREIPGKISQSFQFDESTARYFVELLQREFDL